jgi:hypothetical protein
MNYRQIETGLARFTLCALVIYVPVETWMSLSSGLWNPFYIVDLIAMALLFVGAVRSLRARPNPAPGILSAALAWTAANGWRATFGRMVEIRSGRELDYGTAELWAVGAATAITLGCLAVSLLLVARAERGERYMTRSDL